MSGYGIAPLFLIRATGVPFEHLARLGTTESSVLARELLARRIELATARAGAEEFVGSRHSGLSAAESRGFRAVLRRGSAPAGAMPGQPLIARFQKIARSVASLETQLQATLEKDLAASRTALLNSSSAVLPGYLVFGAGEFRDRLPGEHEPLPPRNSRARERERHLLLYLQRVCAKNDTYSEFGPSAWGRVGGTAGVSFSPRPGMAGRESFLERWAAHALAAGLNDDAHVRLEIPPRLNPLGRIDGDVFVLTDSGQTVPLTAAMLALLARCDGQTPVHLLGSVENLEELAGLRVLLWQVEAPAMEPRAFDTLLADIRAWRDTATRERWLTLAESIGALPAAFSAATDAHTRRQLMDHARSTLTELGGPARNAQRFLYSAANPIAEECVRDLDFTISPAMTDTLTHDLAPWLDLWRDTYAFVASRVAHGLRGLLSSAPVRDGAIPLPAFLQHCAARNMPLTGPGIVVLAHLAFREVKAAFRQMAAAHVRERDWQLTAEDCHFVRRSFEFEAFDAYTYPAADLQISARSFEDVARGEYHWVLSELHPPVALLHHALYWGCPDKPALSQALASTTCGRPSFHFGFFAADFTAHTTVRQFDALPDLTTFVAPQRAQPGWRSVAPAEAEVFVDEASGDVGLRRRGSGEYLGSFARAWLIPLGFHPFNFGVAPHTPRLRCGNVVVQRRAWTVTVEELAPGNFTGLSRDLVLAVEQLRADKNWPRYVYIRPSEQALRRSGAEGRDKDTKPVFVDLESYLSLEIFHRWLTKAGELEVTEMLPDPEHLCWREADGRRTFELRTLIVPRP